MSETNDTENGRGIQIGLIVDHFTRGFLDSINITPVVRFFVRNSKMQELFLKCFLINCALFLGSVVFLDYLFPYAVSQIFDYSEWRTLVWLCLLAKNVLWMYPLYALSIFFNQKWYGRISETCYNTIFKKETEVNAVLDQRRVILKKFNDIVYEQFILSVFLLVSSIIQFPNIPIVGPVLCFFIRSWLYSFNAFNYRWGNNKKLSIFWKMGYVEDNWVYFLGYGSIASVMTILYPFFISAGIWAFLIPLLICLAICADLPNPKPPEDQKIRIKVPVFFLPRKVSEKVFSFVIDRYFL